jgi:small subunit ribosomal protein S1
MVDANKEFLDYLDATAPVNIGDTVTGEVLSVDTTQMVVGLKGNAAGLEGVVPVREFTADPHAVLKDIVKIGDEYDFQVIKTIGSDKEGGTYLLSKRKLESKAAWKKIELNEGDIVDVNVVNISKGGLIVEVQGAQGFVPSSLIDNHFVSNLNQYRGQSFKAKVTEFDPSNERLVLSRKDALSQTNADKINSNVKVGDVIEGKVKSLTTFGAFVEIEKGIDGLVHVSEISQQRVENPSDVLKNGQTITVRVIEIDSQRGRIALSIKQAEPSVWDDVQNKIQIGDTISGTVRSTKDFGTFVEIFPGVEGLIHTNNLKSELKSGDVVDVKVLEVNPSDRRISLSTKD